MATWLLEREVFPDGHAALAGAVEATGGTVVAWSDEWWLTERWPRLGDGVVVFHGSLGNADRIVRERPWRPGAFCATDRFACSAWWPIRPDLLGAPAYDLTTVGELVHTGPPESFGDQVFVRPDSPLKPFSGRVLARDAVTLAALDHGFYYDDLDLPVLVTPTVEIGREWRFVIAQGVVVAGSGYQPDGRQAGENLDPTHGAWRFAVDVAPSYAPEAIYVLDVCETPDGLRVLEVNPFSGADLYTCDRAAVVAAVHRVSEG